MVKEAVGPAAEEKDPRYGWMWSKIMLSFGYTTKQKDKWYALHSQLCHLLCPCR